MTKIRKPVLELTVAMLGVFAALYGVVLFNRHLLMRFALPLRMALMFLTYWSIMLPSGVMMLRGKERLSDVGFRKEGIPRQIAVGALFALALSAVLTVLPVLLGFRGLIGSTAYAEPWKFVFEFAHALFAVSLVEEFVFRGYVFHKLLEIRDCRWFAAALSSALFGLFHVFGGSLVQVLTTAALGFAFCAFREKVRGCTLLSLIVAHGIYDFLIVLWVSVLP